MLRSDLASPVDSIVSIETSRPDHRRDVAALLTSASLHVLLLVFLALWVLPTLSGSKKTLTFSASGDQAHSLETFEFIPAADPLALASSDAPAEIQRAFVVEEMEFSIEEPTSSREQNVAVASFVAPEFSVDSLSSSTSVEGAVDRVTAELNEKLEKGDLLVVWLLDASHSLVDDRQRVAARLTPFYEGLVEGRSSSEHELVSAVVSFGSTMRERVSPTTFGKRIVKAVEDLPVDRSGKENVFDAVAKCAQHYRKSWRDKQLVIAIWTDESGDDVHYLDQTIQLCRDQAVSVSVVGPSSVLGADTGLHSYTDPKTQSVYQLPVLRGPETPMAERIELGYWYLTRMGRPRGPGGADRDRGGFRGQGGRRGPLPSWLGGQDLEGILSGFSPYALTRLATQTGGFYTIFDRPEDRAPFDLAAMKRYAPSYGSLDDYRSDIQSHPLRVAVLRAVTELQGKKIDAPPTMLFIKSTGPRAFDFMRYYYPPQEFQAKVRTSRGRLTGQAARYARVVEAALRHVSTDDDLRTGLDEDYQDDPSPRWRAWYDLTRGRLLANSVRLEEYRLTVNALAQPGSLASSTNHAILIASPQLRSDAKFQQRGEEAERLLRRCARENQSTPWEMLAQRELDFALGVGVREMSLTQEPMGPAIRQPNLPRF